MTGGTLTGAGVGATADGVYSFNSTSGLVATSDASGNPAVVSAASIGLQNGDLTINVTRGPANPPADMIISSRITPFGGSGNGIAMTGNGILVLTATNTYTGATTVNGGGTLQLGTGASGQDGRSPAAVAWSNNATYLVYNLFADQSAHTSSPAAESDQARPGPVDARRKLHFVIGSRLPSVAGRFTSAPRIAPWRYVYGGRAGRRLCAAGTLGEPELHRQRFIRGQRITRTTLPRSARWLSVGPYQSRRSEPG